MENIKGQNIIAGIFANPNKKRALEAVSAAKSILDRVGVRWADCGKPDTIYEGGTVDMLLAIGGDGTILRAIHWMVKGCGTRAPILGVNVGRIGFLSETDLSSLEAAMTRIIEGNYNIETYMMLECTVKDKSFMCVNDFILYKKCFSSVAHIDMCFDGMDAGSVYCDGIIISTPAGSTGYSVSAGGPIISTRLEAVAVTPICSHSLGIRPVVLSRDAVIKLTARDEARFSSDGVDNMDLYPGDEMIVRRSIASMGLIRLHERNEYKLIDEKLR